ncbi:protein phosphatase inhibitor 2-like [Xenia sp. Carnegie-2017]|uniref:protein phosphatase inhibitor 2-like n=1 Tax=Xenia sp. Carnegie-2017 TaxID=2897299 RepID=UPI001F03D8F0|nr:protein phosphatase inhibitor 2-like [Xenia sp. Carnegie-2017]
MASTSSGKTPKGILKQTNSLEDQSVEVHFDEMNILQTYHPSNKDYGHMKINEPPTPYSYSCEDSDTESNEKLDPKKLAEKMQNVESTSKHESYDRNESSSDEDMDLTEEERNLSLQSIFIQEQFTCNQRMPPFLLLHYLQQ